MVATDMVVCSDGRKAGDIRNGDIVDAVLDGERALTQLSAAVLGSPVRHACQLVETTSGARAKVSNNALVYVDDPGRAYRGTVNVQRIGAARIAVLLDGVVQYEAASATPSNDITDVAQMVVPGGAIVAGESADARILFTFPR